MQIKKERKKQTKKTFSTIRRQRIDGWALLNTFSIWIQSWISKYFIVSLNIRKSERKGFNEWRIPKWIYQLSLIIWQINQLRNDHPIIKIR